MHDRDVVIRAVESCFDYWLDQHRCLHPLELDDVRQMKADALALLKEQPEIVRCKNCKHFEPDGIYTMCYRHNGLSQNADWFCADGERRS